VREFFEATWYIILFCLIAMGVVTWGVVAMNQANDYSHMRRRLCHERSGTVLDTRELGVICAKFEIINLDKEPTK
jgi:hypothetical protein